MVDACVALGVLAGTVPQQRPEAVVVSPSVLPSAMSFNNRRMILPLRVLGRPAENITSSGPASVLIFFATGAAKTAGPARPERSEGDCRTVRRSLDDCGRSAFNCQTVRLSDGPTPFTLNR